MFKFAFCLFMGMLFGIPLSILIIITLMYAVFSLIFFKIFSFTLTICIATLEILVLFGFIKILLDFCEGCV